ncbi:MAG TPA: energy transducer TonB [Terriglobales bacterium]|nr:energy transducer TonB [Terriglobales bacterium]
MFADSLLDTPWADRSRRGWTTLVSFALQAAAAGGLLLLPLFYTQGLPQFQLMAALVAPAPPPAPPAPGPLRNEHQTTSNVSSEGKMIAPRSVPREILQVDEPNAPPPVDIGGLSVPGSTGNSMARSGVLDSIGRGVNVIVPPPPPAPSTRPPRVSRMMEGNLIYRVQPQYPPLARQARVQGIVVLRAMITREGKIENLQVVSGHPLLVKSAMDAVLQWRYRPYYLNGEPVEVGTQVTVNFTLSGG